MRSPQGDGAFDQSSNGLLGSALGNLAFCLSTQSPCDNLGPAITCDDDFCGTWSQVAFAATAGHTYLIRVGGYNGSQNRSILSVSCS